MSWMFRRRQAIVLAAALLAIAGAASAVVIVRQRTPAGTGGQPKPPAQFDPGPHVQRKSSVQPEPADKSEVLSFGEGQEQSKIMIQPAPRDRPPFAEAKLWDVATGQELATLTGKTNAMCEVLFTADGKTLVTLGSRGGYRRPEKFGEVKFWDVAMAKARVTLENPAGDIFRVALSPDGKTLATTWTDNTIRLWDTATGDAVATFEGHERQVHSVAFSPDGGMLASGSLDNTVKLWDVHTGTFRDLARFEGEVSLGAAVRFSPDGKLLAAPVQTSGKGTSVHLWELDTAAIRNILDPATGLFAFAPDGKLLAAESGRLLPNNRIERDIKIWDTATGEERAVLKGPYDRDPGRFLAFSCLAFSPNGERLAIGSNDGIVRLWMVATGREEATLRHSVRCLAFSPDGETLAAGSWDGYVRLWDVKSRRERAAFKHTGFGYSIAFSPDGRTLAVGAGDMETRM